MNVRELLKKTGAVLDGHFLLSSGLHSQKYLQCAKLLQYPHYAEEIGRELAARFSSIQRIDLVVGPALGGMIIAHEVAKALKVRCVFVERYEGKMTLRRGFKITKGENVLIVEDVVTTGGSIKETMDVIKGFGGKIVGIGVIVDRSGGGVKFGVPLQSLLVVEIKTYESINCPLCEQGIPLVKPGSR